MHATPPLTLVQCGDLLATARRAIRERVQHLPQSTSVPTDPTLDKPGAAFVTLTQRGGMLRGCIGYVQPLHSLRDAVALAAASAATSDPRFPAVSAAELADLQLEISVLSPLEPMKDPNDIQVGIHGIHVEKDGRRGLLLPQVATEFGWDRETFLDQTCIKAGLPRDAWRRSAAIHLFSVQRITDDAPIGAATA